MEDLIIGREAFIGVGMAMVLGLAVGGVVKPTGQELRTSPQPEMDLASVNREPSAPADPGWARYGAHLPSWVLGTDVLKAAQQVASPPPAAPYVEDARYEPPPEPIAVTPARYEEPPRAESTYPSQGGGTLLDREARPAPPHMDALPDPDAPPS